MLVETIACHSWSVFFDTWLVTGWLARL